MKKIKVLLTAIILCLALIPSQAQYTETMKENGRSVNLQKDYKLKDDNAQKNQSAIIQSAIDDLAAKGGGNIILPKGVYRFSGVYLKSNIHILIEAETVIKPYWPNGEKAVVFVLDTDRKTSKSNPQAYIENVSIRGIGGRFVVDYHDRIRKKGEGCRAIVLTMVKNFMISDMDVKDNYTTYCGMTLSPTKTKQKDISKWKVSRPTNGIIRDCRIFRASPGYGLVQLHGTQDVHFENLYSLGGVCLRLETGANNQHVGVFNVTGDKIYSENGRSALMMGPHSAKNGLVTVTNLAAKSSTYAVHVGQAGVKKDAPDQTPGYFDNASTVSNIYAIHGEKAQIKKHSMLDIPLEYYSKLKMWPDNKFMEGPSIGATENNAEEFTVTLKDIHLEGFTYNTDKKILSHKDTRPGKWGTEVKKWQEQYNDAAHKTNYAQVITEYSIPKKTFADDFKW